MSGATVAILASGKYKPVEVFSTIMVVFFTIATLFALGESADFSGHGRL